uniref:Uncharacterized protein n=1 Tax=Tetranychus urticae TaxID=32264 RepID=T1K457_TETUR
MNLTLISVEKFDLNETVQFNLLVFHSMSVKIDSSDPLFSLQSTLSLPSSPSSPSSL